MWNDIRKAKEAEKQQKQEEKQILNKLIAEKGFKLENIELVDAEENNIPMIIEEK